jgi:hypothetical protein
VIAIHDKSVQSFAELDKKLAKIKERYWQGKDLPFPVLLDATGKTEELYEIRGHPTGLLIDPDGKLVGTALPADLEAKLPPLPAGKLWARHRDVIRTWGHRRHWSFEPSHTTLNELADELNQGTGCPIELDAEAIQASGLSPNSPLPSAVFGGPITLRTIVELLLAPHGLGVAPSPDGKKLLITRQPAPAEAESYLQKFRARELTDRLHRGPAADSSDEAKPVEIKNEPLLDAIKRISQEFHLPVALDAKAMRANTLDPTAKVSGRITPGDLRTSLTKMLDPLGLTVEVRHEVVFVTPRSK